MAKTWNEITMDQLEFVAKSLKDSQAKIADIMFGMTEHKMATVFAPWTKAHVQHLSAITKFVNDTLREMDDQIAAKKFGQKSRVELEKIKAAKTVKRRKKIAETDPNRGKSSKKKTVSGP